MQEKDKPKSEDTEVQNSDATSKETVADLEDSEKSSDSKSTGEKSSGPSPDGALDQRSEKDSAGPM